MEDFRHTLSKFLEFLERATLLPVLLGYDTQPSVLLPVCREYIASIVG